MLRCRTIGAQLGKTRPRPGFSFRILLIVITNANPAAGPSRRRRIREAIARAAAARFSPRAAAAAHGAERAAPQRKKAPGTVPVPGAAAAVRGRQHLPCAAQCGSGDPSSPRTGTAACPRLHAEPVFGHVAGLVSRAAPAASCGLCASLRRLVEIQRPVLRIGVEPRHKKSGPHRAGRWQPGRYGRPMPTVALGLSGTTQFWKGVFSAKYSWLSALSSALVGLLVARFLAAAWP